MEDTPGLTGIRLDIWAFGIVLFEMLAGKPCFAGQTVSDYIAARVVEIRADKIFHLGDLGGYAPFMNEVVEFLIEHSVGKPKDGDPKAWQNLSLTK
jgi:serine/threonine protein kinase